MTSKPLNLKYETSRRLFNESNVTLYSFNLHKSAIKLELVDSTPSRVIRLSETDLYPRLTQATQIEGRNELWQTAHLLDFSIDPSPKQTKIPQILRAKQQI